MIKSKKHFLQIFFFQVIAEFKCSLIKILLVNCFSLSLPCKKGNLSRSVFFFLNYVKNRIRT